MSLLWRLAPTASAKGVARKLATSQSSSTNEMFLKNMLTVTQVTRSLQAHRSDFTYLSTTVNVPHEAPWPMHLRGQSLNGNYLRQLHRRKLLPAAYVEAFDALQFVWCTRSHKWTVRLLALEAYRTLHGDLRVPHLFVVPDLNPAWPKDTWGLHLGFHVSNIRTGRIKCSDETRAKLDALGFVWDMFHAMWETNLLALQEYARRFGNVNVPQVFVAPDDWPRETRGALLGVWVNNIRNGVDALTPEKITQLNQMGFLWKGNNRRKEPPLKVTRPDSTPTERYATAT
ncbi:hypothetical protein SDRG_00044 [Saprolegnia diclina VS20]|uniref:Helicase-associated domain-containing protein n=1 Tax=Saprolegnia diclina (strain VS20) TaxID=1156394 RepID=T0R772_SAPDV|nr:hypothetical protein SDRG_00044 [Saprolegnia diclina VS20]EQC42305.1 hypothetical protein SDRG_00044 [Saprolegnia diclina VS20]|eukprot:XP_008603728.1 hypothetical protein SDRG_00044 [Saprolegnia diclina VS20]